MPNYIEHGLVHKKDVGKQTTSGQNAKGENRFESGAHQLSAGRLCEAVRR